MKSRMSKLAAAAVIVAAALFALMLSEKGAAPAYALAHTIAANHTIQTLHLRISRGEQSGEDNEGVDCWVEYDDEGVVSHFRQNFYGDVREDDDNLKFVVWNEGVVTTWLPLKKVAIILRVSNVEEYWQSFAEHFDPKLILQRLYDDCSEDEAIELNISEPARAGDPIRVEATYSADSTRLELLVDPQTSLVREYSRYSLGEQEDRLDMRIEFLAYNQPIDPSVFVLSDIPDDATVFDQVDQLVGLEKGDLTDNEIAAEVVHRCLDATIAEDYEEVSRLMEGDPGDSVEVFVREQVGAARMRRVVAIGEPEPDETWPNILCVPCEVEVEDGQGAVWTVTITATAKAIGYQPGCRWIMHTALYADPQGCIVKGTIVPGVGVGDYVLGMSMDDVLASLGEPEDILYREEKYTLDNLPRKYYMVFADLSFFIVDGSVKGFGVHKPFYTFTNGLGVGGSEDDIIQAFGDDYQLMETEWKDVLTYEDEGLTFEIHKTKRTATEIGVAPRAGD